LHVIFGTGPVGCWIAQKLIEQNQKVRAINRTGKRPDLLPEGVELRAADVTNPQLAVAAAEGAGTIYQALNPPYHLWHQFFPALQKGALEAAKATGASYISIENLYMYNASVPITETSPIAPQSKKGELRTKMAEEVLNAHLKGDVRAVLLRSSDYYGPGVLGSALGERVFGKLVLGQKAELGGSATTPHAWAYIEDVAKAAITLASNEKAFGKVWISPHAPAVTQAEVVEKTARILGREAKFTVISPLMMRLAGFFIPEARASVEMMYEFTKPFLVDSSQIELGFGLHATPVGTGLEKTVTWYQSHLAKA
ncbi:MAG: NAD-dependent epimerase/dehydratase family protein, partial [Trueperaceae bacterium]|nr:NAD-dependent epimerase/dehydratase family protein [Trueperaceae bacterium]